jgi:hypothetical protein
MNTNRAEDYPLILTWFYCNGRSEGPKRKPRYIFGGIYRQILEALEVKNIVTPSRIITHLQNMQKEERKYSDAHICHFFGQYYMQVLKDESMKPLYILVDGIDESPEAVEIATTLLALEQNCRSVRVLLTCRPERRIEEVLDQCPRIETTADTFAPDRKKCLEWNLKTDEKLKAMDLEIKEKIIKELLSKEKAVYHSRSSSVLTSLY